MASEAAGEAAALAKLAEDTEDKGERPAGRPLEADDEKESDSDFDTDFESLSSGLSEISEIPEAILQESSSESSSSSVAERRRPGRRVVLAWSAPGASLEDTSRSFQSLGAPTPRRSLVRRARVRGTLRLTTSAFSLSGHRRAYDSGRQRRTGAIAAPVRDEIGGRAKGPGL